ncbi:MAG: tripartite tricarboxylate transporter substrate binding protein [Ramlibacter sp.]|jgi:tripartite-type tricarboxylate transporter receptor subunit TctC|nr:tripartite tricarboxylate transporter substrate binding protein [Ramlibacter sp.]MDB5912794.1 tripartite tricarboxylate transporter substrate binding protein [Ramlibacter sp.]
MIRSFAGLLLVACTLATAPLSASAQAYPRGGTITLVVPLAPGDAADTTARALADEMGRLLQTTIVVSNRPGAGGSLGVQNVIAARKDGYTLLFAQNSALTIRRVLEPQAAAYDPLKDLTPLGITTRSPSVLVVRRDAPYNTFQEMIAQAKKAPGSVRIGTPGAGSAGDLSVQLINAQAGVDLSSIPYKGAAPVVSDMLGGQIDGAILALGALSAHIRSGALKPIAISSPFRELPDVPTLARLGYKQDILGIWFGVFAPAGTPPEVAQALLPALEKATENPSISQRLLPLGIVQDWEPAPRLAAAITSEHDAVADLMRRMQTRKP